MRLTRLAPAVALIAGLGVAAPAGAESMAPGGPVPVRFLDVNLYRGLVRVRADARADTVTVVPGLVPWDTWVRGTDPRPLRRSLASDALEMEVSRDTVRISAPTIRDVTVLDLTVPATAALRIHIDHFGDVEVDSLLGGIEIEQFQGAIILRDVPGPVSAHIVRDGDIRARLAERPAARPMAFTTYEGGIDLEVPAAVSSRLSVATVEGEIRNQLPRSSTPSSADAEARIIVRNARGVIHVRPLH